MPRQAYRVASTWYLRETSNKPKTRGARTQRHFRTRRTLTTTRLNHTRPKPVNAVSTSNWKFVHHCPIVWPLFPGPPLSASSSPSKGTVCFALRGLHRSNVIPTTVESVANDPITDRLEQSPPDGFLHSQLKVGLRNCPFVDVGGFLSHAIVMPLLCARVALFEFRRVWGDGMTAVWFDFWDQLINHRAVTSQWDGGVWNVFYSRKHLPIARWFFSRVINAFGDVWWK